MFLQRVCNRLGSLQFGVLGVTAAVALASCKPSCIFLGECLGMELLGPWQSCSTFEETIRLLSNVAVPFCAPTSGV